MVRSLIIALVLTGCGRFEPQGRPDTTKFEIEDPDFLVYLRKFEKASETRKNTKVINIIIEYGNTGGSKIGICTLDPKDAPRITIDRKYWAKASEMEKETLMFHELGHCRLKRKHRDDVVDGRPVSLMYPSSIWQWYRYRPPAYQDELFSITDDWFTLIEEDEHYKCEYEL